MGTSPRRRKSMRNIERQLVRIYMQGGYVRRQNQIRKSLEGYTRYKKGDELRLIVASPDELKRVRSLLVKTGFKPGSWFEKGNRYCQPIYGRESVARFLQMVDTHADI